MARKVGNGLDLQSQRIQNVASPSSSTDAANKAYVDAAINGLTWHPAVRAATTTAGTLASSYANGSVIDGVTLATGDRILVKNQATGSENGIYVVAATGAPARAADMATGTTADNAALFVEEGTTLADTAWVLTNNGTVTVGTTALTFSQWGAGAIYTAGNGITISSNVVTAVAASGGGLSVVSGGIQVDTTKVVEKYAVSIGDGSSTSYTVTHNLGTLDVTVTIYDNSSGAEILTDVTHATTNTLTIAFATAPTSSQYRVVCHG